jgi:hypothetical protein
MEQLAQGVRLAAFDQFAYPAAAHTLPAETTVNL